MTNFGDQKSRKMAAPCQARKPRRGDGADGCYPQASPDEAAEIKGPTLVTGSGNRHAILTDVQKVLNGEERVVDIRPHRKGERLKNCPWISSPSTPAPL